jgi:hypothetical protein
VAPPPPLMPGHYVRATMMSRRMEFLGFAAARADLASANQEAVLKEWNEHATIADTGRRMRVWTEARRREDNMGFSRPSVPASNSKVLQRAKRAHIKHQCAEMLDLDQNIEDNATYMTSLREGAASMTLDLRAIMRWAAPGVWNSARSNFVPGKTVTTGQRASIVKMAAMLVERPLMRHEMFCMLEILDGPGNMEEKWTSVESAEWEPEAEDVLQRTAVWHGKTHRILREKVTPDTLPALKKELVRRSKPGYILPEKVAGSENLRSVEKEWEFVFMEQVTQHVMQPEARQVARLMCGKTKHLTAERHKEIRTALRGTDLHEAAKNSAFCRMMLGRPPLSPTLEWPDEFDEYDMVNMEADGVCHTVQAAALQSVLEEVMQGAGDGKDKHPHRVRVQDLRILPGPKNTGSM